MEENAVPTEANNVDLYPQFDNEEPANSARKLIQPNQVFPVNDDAEAQLEQIEQQMEKTEGMNQEKEAVAPLEIETEIDDNKEYKEGIIVCICFSVPTGICLFFTCNLF